MPCRSLRKLLPMLLIALSFALHLGAIAGFAQQQPVSAAMAHRKKKPTPAQSIAARLAPRFEATTLEGQRFTNASLEGNVVLLQFWTTRCPRCLADQRALDDLDTTFTGQALIVLAVDEGDSAATVRKFLKQHPRTCRIALDPKKQLARRFGVTGYPYYVAIDRQGRIAATQRGAAGGQGLLALVSHAGLRPPAKPQAVAVIEEPGPAQPSTTALPLTAPPEAAASAPPAPTPPKVIDVPREGPAQAKPIPKAVFVLTNGERIESGHYTLDADNLRVTVDGRQRTIPTSQLDENATEAANRERGLELKIPTRGRDMVVGF